MNWPSMEKLRVALIACGLVVAGCCCVAACDSISTGEQAQAKAEDEEPREAVSRAPLTEGDVLAFLQGEQFEVAGVGLGFSDSTEDTSVAGDDLVVRLAGRDVWVFEVCRENDEARAAREDKLAGAFLGRLNIPEGACDTSALPCLHVIDSLSPKIASAFEGRLTDVRLCALAWYLAGHELAEPSSDEHADQQDTAALEELLGQDAVQKLDCIEYRSIPLRQGDNSGCLHWVMMGAGDFNLEKISDEGQLISSIEEHLRAATQRDASPADEFASPDDTTGDSTSTIQKNAGPSSPNPSSPGSIEVVEQPSNGGSRTDGDTGGTPSGPDKPQERVWVVDKAAWDEYVLTTPAWDEQVWVEKLEWVPDNVWVVDQAAWDEQVVVQEGYYESVPSTTHYRFFADGYVTYDDDDMLAHLKELLAQDLPTNYCVEWEYERVWHEPEYSWVHHDEVGHWEDRGSYQDKGYYQTVHHEAQYTTVHHDEEGHWE